MLGCSQNAKVDMLSKSACLAASLYKGKMTLCVRGATNVLIALFFNTVWLSSVWVDPASGVTVLVAALTAHTLLAKTAVIITELTQMRVFIVFPKK